jgi:hypothetical protein
VQLVIANCDLFEQDFLEGTIGLPIFPQAFQQMVE